MTKFMPIRCAYFKAGQAFINFVFAINSVKMLFSLKFIVGIVKIIILVVRYMGKSTKLKSALASLSSNILLQIKIAKT